MPVPPAPVAKQDSLHFDVEIYSSDLPKLEDAANPLHHYLETFQALEAENLSLPIVYKGVAGTLHGRPLHSLKPQRDRDEQPGVSEKRRTPSFVFGLYRDVVLALAAQDFGRINSLLFEPARVEADTASGTGTLRLLRSGLVLSSVFPTREPGGNAAAPTP